MSNTKKPFEEMTDAEWLKYYRDTYGTPKETPSLSADAQFQQQSHRLDEYYNAQSEAYKQSKAQQKEDAYVLYQRMQKYMPEYLKSLGMTGLAVSETYASQASNDYQNNLSAIEQAYRQEQSALDQEKFDRQSDLEAAYLTNKQNGQAAIAEAVYAPKFEQIVTELDAEMDSNGGFVSQESYDNAMNWIESNKSKLPPELYEAYKAQLTEFFDTESEGIQKDATKATKSDGYTFYGVNAKTEEEDRQYRRTVVTRNMEAITEAAKKLYGEEIPYGTVYAKKKANGETVYFMYGVDKNGNVGWMRQKASVKDKTKNSNKRANQIGTENEKE